MSNGFIYKSTYEGWYCTSDETFVSESLVVLNDNNIKVSLESGNAVEWSTEENYIFKLTHFKEQLLDWINSGDVIKPSVFADILRHDIQKGLRDLSVSRPKSRLNWGITVPNDDSQIVRKPIVFEFVILI
jgi:methionyl-tRNA synthetase